MSGKRGKKKRKFRESPSIGENQSFTDFLCPICLQILIKPVQLPCQHELCMECFKMHVENTSLQCPMCRLRISIWVRKNTKSNTLINEDRWNLIKSLFPERVKRRLSGEDDLESSFSEYNAPKHVIANTGELRREYEEELKKIQAENAADNQANLEYIETLTMEEEFRKKQEQLDLATAESLQKEEMESLGVKLKSPTSHQREILALWKPKSPMKLRLRDKAGSSCPKKVKTITSFFKPSSTKTAMTVDSSSSTTNLERPCTSKLRTSPRLAVNKRSDEMEDMSLVRQKEIDCDKEFARKLQARFNAEMNSPKIKHPLKQTNSSLSKVFSPDKSRRCEGRENVKSMTT